MSTASRAYCQRRLAAIDRQLAERRSYLGPTDHGILGRIWAGKNVDDLLDQRAKWAALLQQQQGEDQPMPQDSRLTRNRDRGKITDRGKPTMRRTSNRNRKT
jgi:hypothetical protein